MNAGKLNNPGPQTMGHAFSDETVQGSAIRPWRNDLAFSDVEACNVRRNLPGVELLILQGILPAPGRCRQSEHEQKTEK